MSGLNFQLSTLLHKLWALKSAGEVHSPILSLLLRSSETYNILQLQPRGKSAHFFSDNVKVQPQMHQRSRYCARNSMGSSGCSLQTFGTRENLRTIKTSTVNDASNASESLHTQKGVHGIRYTTPKSPSKSTDESSYVMSHHIISYHIL